MSMGPKTHLCGKCGEFHPVICDKGPFGRAAKDEEISALNAVVAGLRADRDAARAERDAAEARAEGLAAGATEATQRWLRAEAERDAAVRDTVERCARLVDRERSAYEARQKAHVAADGDMLGDVYRGLHERIETTVVLARCIRALAPPTPGVPVGPTACEAARIAAEADPYCSLAASEIPGFGTDRDRHRCAKLHRDKPLPRTPLGGPTPRPTCDVTGCTKGPGHYHEMDGKTYYYPNTWKPDVPASPPDTPCGRCNGAKLVPMLNLDDVRVMRPCPTCTRGQP